ncbi:MAG: hypothetical protein R3B06_08720 [Kofleriaceae bacterium]
MSLRAVAALALGMVVGTGSVRADPDWTAKLVARADDIATRVAALRGLAMTRPIAKGIMDDAQLRARILTRMDEDSPAAERAKDAAMAKRWGLVPMATDLDRLVVDLLTEQIAGFYDPAEGKLYVSAKPATDDAWADMLMAHEITHALQDQRFGLDGWMAAVKDDGDASSARQALVEGDGVALMIEFMLSQQGLAAPWDHDDVVKLLTAGMDSTGAAGSELMDAAPVAMREGMLFPYRAGVAFVAALRKGKPWSAVDAAFARPPRSTEQIIHPALYFADERPDVVTLPAGYASLDSSVWGEEGWREFLVSHGVDRDQAASASAGWGGDRVALRGGADAVAHPARSVGVAVTTWDTEVDALEFWDAATKAVDHLAGGLVVARSPTRVVWMTWRGRATALEARGRQVVIVTGAAARTWADELARAWTWPVAWTPRR